MQTIPNPDFSASSAENYEAGMADMTRPIFLTPEQRNAVEVAVRMEIDAHRDNAALFVRIANRWAKAGDSRHANAARGNAATEEKTVSTLESALFQINPDL